MTPAQAAALEEMPDEDGNHEFLEARKWACNKIPGTTTALLRRTKNGLVAEDYLVGLRTSEHATIPTTTWQEALATAQTHGEVEDLLNAIGYQAVTAGLYGIAEQAWTPVAYGNSEQAFNTLRNLGLVLKWQGDLDRAQAAFQKVIQSGDPDVAPAAAYSLGMLLAEQDPPDVAGRQRPTSKPSTPATPSKHLGQ